MKANRLEITIALGNAAMSRQTDIASALAVIAKRIERGDQSGKVMDVNGNPVGTFEFKGD